MPTVIIIDNINNRSIAEWKWAKSNSTQGVNTKTAIKPVILTQGNINLAILLAMQTISPSQHLMLLKLIPILHKQKVFQIVSEETILKVTIQKINLSQWVRTILEKMMEI